MDVMIVDVKHAGPDALNKLERLLAQLRQFPDLKEQRPGTFYRGSRAFLHFHEDPAGLFADVRLTAAFERFEVTTTEQQEHCLRCIQNAAP